MSEHLIGMSREPAEPTAVHDALAAMVERLYPGSGPAHAETVETVTYVEDAGGGPAGVQVYRAEAVSSTPPKTRNNR